MLKREGKLKNSQKRDIFNVHVWSQVGTDKIEITLLPNITQKLVASPTEGRVRWVEIGYINVCNIMS